MSYWQKAVIESKLYNKPPRSVFEFVLLGLICSFRSEVWVKVDPAAEVKDVERNIRALLSDRFRHKCHDVIPKHGSLNIQPVGASFFKLTHEWCL